MGEEGDVHRSDDDRIIERGQTYDHDQHGQVEVTGIWQGVQEVDETRNTGEKDVIIVRYFCKSTDGGQVEDFTDTLDQFLEATE